MTAKSTRDRRRQNGLCIDCGIPIIERKFCKKCVQIRSSRNKEARAKIALKLGKKRCIIHNRYRCYDCLADEHNNLIRYSIELQKQINS